MGIRRQDRGGALLAVLWLSAALSAIAFSLATTVRSETERTSTHADRTRAYYLATGAVDRALLYMLWGPGARNPDGSPRHYEPGMARLEFRFPSGIAQVEIIPEYAKLNVNTLPPQELLRLLINMGVDPPMAGEVAESIVDWRQPRGGSPMDTYYSSSGSTFLPRHASLVEVEELLFVKGMTPDLFHGAWTRDPQGRLQPRSGLKDCLSVYGSQSAVDVNYAEPAVLLTAGLTPEQVSAVAGRRRALPFRNMQQVQEFLGGGPGLGRLQVGGGSVFSLRATSTLLLPNGALSDVRRSVTALVKFREYGYNPPIEILRWYEN